MGKLIKQLGLSDVFAVAAGAMISSGLFVLPAIAYAKAGPAVIVSYLLASIMIMPSVLSKAELSTAMPRAGGTYFFVERSMGSIWGLFSGLASWFSLALKSAFAIVGMAILVEITIGRLWPRQISPGELKVIAVFCCVVFTALNALSVKHTGRFQLIFVAVLLLILGVFVIFGFRAVEISRYKGFLKSGWAAVFATSGLVFVSFGGLTKVASIAEEVKNPGKNLPRGLLSAWLVVSLLYFLVIAVTIGVLDRCEMVAVVDGRQQIVTLMPLSVGASKFMGPFGFFILSVAAMAAFVTTANGGILSASRVPMAMSRDQLAPAVLARVSERFKTPHISILLTGALMVSAIVLLDIERLIKTASTLMIILFMLDNVSVIIMRESRIQSYRPRFKSPLYPYMHIAAILVYATLIIDMGVVPLSITAAFFALSAAWYVLYVRRRVSRASAVMHIVERVTDKQLKTVTLENELRDILLERDEIVEDRFDRLVRDAKILDVKGRQTAEHIFREIAGILEKRLDLSEYVLFEKFLQREAEGGTVIEPGLAIPHIVVEGNDKFDIVLVRAKAGIEFPNVPEPVRIVFVLAGTRDQRNYHLRALMAIAQVAQEKNFQQRWLNARGVAELRNLVLLSKRKRDAMPKG